MMRSDTVQRLRVTYGIDGPLRYTSVLDMGRLWERLLRRARVPLAYTQGYSPHPRLQFAAALPVGYGSTCELVDILLAERMELHAFTQAIVSQAPQGLAIAQVEEMPLKAESPQSTMRAADYRVTLWTPAERAHVEAALPSLMERPSISRRRIKKGQMADYDLRPLIYKLQYVASVDGGHELSMTLACGSHGAGRAEEIMDELAVGVTHYSIQRIRLVWGD